MEYLKKSFLYNIFWVDKMFPTILIVFFFFSLENNVVHKWQDLIELWGMHINTMSQNTEERD